MGSFVCNTRRKNRKQRKQEKQKKGMKCGKMMGPPGTVVASEWPWSVPQACMKSGFAATKRGFPASSLSVSPATTGSSFPCLAMGSA